MALGGNVKARRQKNNPLIPTESVPTPKLEKTEMESEPVKSKEQPVAHCLRIPITLEQRFNKFQMEQVMAGTKRKNVNFNKITTEALDNFLKSKGY